MSLKSRFLVFSVIFVLLVAAFYAFVSSRRRDLAQVRHRIEEDWEEMRILFDLQVGLTTIHTDIERYGLQSNLEEFRKSFASLRADFGRMETLSAKHLIGDEAEDEEREALSDLSLGLDKWEKLLADFAAGGLAATEFRERASRLYSESNQALVAYSNGCMSELDNSLSTLAESEARLALLSRQLVVGLTGLLLFAWFGLSYWLLRPINRLRRLTKRIRRREFDVESIPHGPDEIGELVDSFIEMSSAIGSFTSDLEQKVRERTEALEASEGRLRQMLDNLPDAVGLSRDDGSIIHSNAAYRAMFGEPSKSPIQKLRETAPTPEGLTPWTDGGGSQRLLAIHVHQLRGGDFTQGSVLLEHVRDMTLQVGTANALASSQKLAAVGRLSSGLAHEINNPLTAIGACAEGLLKRLRLGDLDPEVTSEYLKTIYDEVFRCKEITEKLLDFSRRREGKTAQIEVREILTDVLRLAGALANRAAVTIRFSSSADTRVVSDAAAIRQIALNLIINAIEACNEGGVVNVSLESTPDAVSLRVEDNGVGIPPEVASQIFEPFFTGRRDGSGTGLGLFVCQSLAQVLGGTVTSQSDGQNSGATFTLTLPRHLAVALRHPTLVEEPAYRG